MINRITIPATAPRHPQTGFPSMPATVEKPWQRPKPGPTTSPSASAPSAPSASAPTAPPVPYQRHIVDAHEIPAALRELNCWVAWRLKPKGIGKKPGKEPISPITGGMTGWTDPANQATFEQARDYAEAHHLHGLGIVLMPDDGLIGGDLDHCRDIATGELSEAAKAILSEADTYTEVSPGLSGIRFFAFGTFGGHTGRSSEHDVEFYEQGRWLTITGDHIEDTPFSVERRDLSELGRRYFPQTAKAKAEETSIPPGFKPVDLDSIPVKDFTRHVITTGECQHYDGDRSKALFGVAKDLARLGLDDATIACILCDPANGISAKALEERFGNVESAMEWTMIYTVAKAREEVAAEPALTEAFLQGLKAGPPASAATVDPTEGQAEQGKPAWFAHVSELMEQPAPLEYLIRDFLLPDSLVLLFGDPESGKSLLALEWAASVATGRDWLGRSVKQGPAVIIAGEGHHGLRRRLKAWSIEHDCEEELRAAPIYVSRTGTRLIDKAALQTVVAELDAIAQQAGKPAVIIVDTLHRNLGGEENSETDIGNFIRAADALRERYGCTVLTVHHSGHGDKTRSRGSSSLRGGVDIEFCLTKDASGLRTLASTKTKDMGPTVPIGFEVKQVELPWLDSDGVAEVSIVLEAREVTASPRRKTSAPGVRLAFESLLGAMAEAGEQPPEGWHPPKGAMPERIVPNDAWRQAHHARHTGDKTDTKDKAFRRAKADLVKAGAVDCWHDIYWPSPNLAHGAGWPDLASLWLADTLTKAANQ